MYDVYPFEQSSSGYIFSFISIGKAKLQKLVTFKKIRKAVYRVDLVELDQEEKPLSEFHISNNGDRDKVIATCFAIMEYFFTYVQPDAVISIAGSEVVRIHLYMKKL